MDDITIATLTLLGAFERIATQGPGIPVTIGGKEVTLAVTAGQMLESLIQKRFDEVDANNAANAARRAAREEQQATTLRELAADIEDVFADLDLTALNDTVLVHRQVDVMRVIEALDDMFGEIAHPYASEDEDGDL